VRSAYLVTGAEPLLIAEAATAIRQAARAAGYAEREVHFIERGFDWDELLRDSANLSLFATRRLIELKFNATPDAVAQRALADLAADPPPDTLLLVVGELDRKPLGAAWVKAFEQGGVLVVGEAVGGLFSEVEVDAADGHVHGRQPPGGGVALLAVDTDRIIASGGGVRGVARRSLDLPIPVEDPRLVRAVRGLADPRPDDCSIR